jgi:hypothetical protein
MTHSVFLSEIQKLVNSFGKTQYSQDRIDIIWVAVQDLSDDWFKLVVRGMLLTERQAPLPSAIVSLAERERLTLNWSAHQAEQENQEDLELKNSIYTDEDRKMFLKTITDRIQGKVSDDDWAAFNSLIKNPPSQTRVCKYCKNSGVLVTKKTNYVYKCNCDKGLSDNRKFPFVPTELINRFNLTTS